MIDYKALLMGCPIRIATKEVQRRKHHKKRINKKWAKRYGFIEVDYIPQGKVITTDGAIWMTRKDFNEFKRRLAAESDGEE